MSDFFIDLIPVIFLAIIIFPKMSIDKDSSDVVTTQNKMNMLRGFFAVFIITAHSTMAMDNVSLMLYSFSKLTTICVGFFFACSGYGLMFSSDNKQNYLSKRFLVNKPLFLFIISILTYIYLVMMRSLISLLFDHSSTSYMGIGDFWKSTNWYLKEQILFYIIFYLTYKWVKKPHRIAMVISLLTVLLCGIFCYLGVNRSFYISSMGFPLGICIYVYRNEIERMFNKIPYLVHLICAFMLFIISCYCLVVPDYSISDVVFHNMFAVMAYVVIMLIVMKLKIGNKILNYLTKISLELYVCQFAVLLLINTIWYEFGLSLNGIRSLTVVMLTIIIASIAHKINNQVRYWLSVL